jgi:uridine phosphorylase
VSQAPFLTAEWRHVAMLNYEVEQSALFDLARSAGY